LTSLKDELYHNVVPKFNNQIKDYSAILKVLDRESKIVIHIHKPTD